MPMLFSLRTRNPVMSLIPYLSRSYQPEPLDPDDAGPISIKLTKPNDPILVCEKDDNGLFIYQRLTTVTVTTGFPFEIEHPDYEPVERTVIQIKTQDKKVQDLEAIATWFPFSFDRECTSSFKGHNNRTQAASLKVREQVCNGTIDVDFYLRTNQYRDLCEKNSKILTAYFPVLKRTDKFVWSGQRRKTKSMGELLAFGLCKDFYSAVEEIYDHDPKILDLRAEINPSILQRFWKNHPVCRQLDPLSEKLIEDDRIERILKGAIRKALAGPIQNQESFVGTPVASWARCIFLSALYNLSRTKEFKSDLKSTKRVAEEPRSLDFEVLVGTAILLVQDWDGDDETLLRKAVALLSKKDPIERRTGLALILALHEEVEIDDEVREIVRKIQDHDVDPTVREDTAKVLKQLERSSRRGGAKSE